MVNNKPLVTIAIPMYNAETTISDAIKSVFVQTYTNWELLLMDDGSTDNTLAFVSKIKDKRVRVIADGQNKGLVYRLNQIPLLAKGDYLARMDADDMMDPARIEAQIEFLLLSPEVDLVDTGTYSISEKGQPIGIRGLNDLIYDSKFVINNAMLLHASVIGKKQWFLNNLYDPNYVRAEDRELWVRTHKSSSFKRIKRPLYIVREGRVSIKNYILSMQTIRKILLVYGPAILTKKEIFQSLLGVHIKIFSYKMFGMLNLQNLLTKQRNLKLKNEDYKSLIKIMEFIKARKIPM